MDDTTYGELFASIYDEHFRFAADLAAPIVELHEHVAGGSRQRSLLDVACGTGTLAVHLAEHGYEAVGIDLAPAMVAVAQAKLAALPDDRRAGITFLVGDGRSFDLGRSFGLATATGDAVNHLSSLDDVERLFAAVRRHLVRGAPFVFDVHTEFGLREQNFVNVGDYDDVFLLTRIVYNSGAHRATARITGFVPRGREWRRFVQEAEVTAWPIADLGDALGRAGFAQWWVAPQRALMEVVGRPEESRRAFVVAVA